MLFNFVKGMDFWQQQISTVANAAAAAAIAARSTNTERSSSPNSAAQNQFTLALHSAALLHFQLQHQQQQEMLTQQNHSILSNTKQKQSIGLPEDNDEKNLNTNSDYKTVKRPILKFSMDAILGTCDLTNEPVSSKKICTGIFSQC